MSTLLTCESLGLTPEMIGKCIKELSSNWTIDELNQFTTSNAAHDLDFLLSTLSPFVINVHLYGVSYEMYLVQRWLALHDAHHGIVKTVTLDGVCQMDKAMMPLYDRFMDQVGRSFLEQCQLDLQCAAQFHGRGTIELATSIFQSLLNHQPRSLHAFCIQQPFYRRQLFPQPKAGWLLRLWFEIESWQMSAMLRL